jgi:putative ABC transport system permease protein
MSAVDPTARSRRWLRLKRAFRLGLKSLWLHRLRSLLTVMGIVFGVCSVIAMLAIGEGASYEAQEAIKNLGSQNIILRSVKPPEDQKVSDQGSQSSVLAYGITYTDVKRIRATIPGVTVMMPARIMNDYVWHISRRQNSEIIGTVPWYPQLRNRHMAAGRFFTDGEMDQRSAVCVLGTELAKSLFPINSPLGRDVRVGSTYYSVIGVIDPPSKAAGDVTGMGGGGTTLGEMFIPLETARLRYGDLLIKRSAGSSQAERVELHEVTVKVESTDSVGSVAEAVKQVLEHTHKKKDYELVVPLDLLRQKEKTKKIFNIVLGSIAAISLVVGGIGIMNIMLATVTERTREIGIRRALGARRHDIVTQFLVETVILSGAGGILGVALGILVPLIVTQFAGMKTIVTFWSPALAFTISALVGVVFGIYPAIRAAKMDPVEALRHE